jgi:hypothetical protein
MEPEAVIRWSLISLVGLFVSVVFSVSLAVEIRMNLIWARQAMDYLRERRHKREMERADKQLALEKAKQHMPCDLVKGFSLPSDLKPLRQEIIT